MTAPRPPLQLPPYEPQPVPSDVAERISKLSEPLDASQVAQLADYLGRLLAMNTVVNLISRVDPANAWDRHILDSLTLLLQLTFAKPGARLLDVGSGGGLPGIPIAIARRDLSVTLLDATQKKVLFLTDVIDSMKLENATSVWGRAEVVCKGEMGASFDVVTARAVTGLTGLLKLTAPFVKPGGRLLLTKGAKAEQELVEAESAIARAGLALVLVESTPTGRIVVLEKRH